MKLKHILMAIFLYIGSFLCIMGGIFGSKIDYIESFGIINEAIAGRVTFVIVGILCLVLAISYTIRSKGAV